MHSHDRRQVALVTTTIHVPHCLDDYLANAERHGWIDQTSVVVVGDRKTPAAIGEYLGTLGRRFPAKITYLDVDAQRGLMRRWPALDLALRYDCIQRRNVGYLQAASDGADVIISVDDDNFVAEGDFIGHHLTVGHDVQLPVVEHSSGWWNVCRQLVSAPPRRFYHRGYPKSQQDWTTDGVLIEPRTVRPVVNAGLWLKNPDVDASTNMEEPINVVSMEPVSGSSSWSLGPGTWCPFNSQNTAFDVKTLPAMYLVVMLDTFRGYRIGRLDDIWMSYFVRAIADQLGDSVVYGAPLVVQDRNPHNFLHDLTQELGGYVLTETLIGQLRAFRTTERDYLGAYLDLIYHLRECAETDPGLGQPEREYLRLMVLGMAAWHEASSSVLGRITKPSAGRHVPAPKLLTPRVGAPR
ncbi:MAG: hypothetical protein P4L84_06155 [Isosphaeraceae bacterium]|nr:hypothetical protein [Isosphaeraceae bacterium]